MFTKHAKKRCQQRAVTLEICDLVQEYGSYRYDNRGGLIFFFSDHALDRIEKELGLAKRKDAEKKSNVYLVQSSTDSDVITVCRAKRKKNTGLSKQHRIGSLH